MGNPLRMSGWFLVDGPEVLWSHVHEHVGAEPRFEELERAFARREGRES